MRITIFLSLLLLLNWGSRAQSAYPQDYFQSPLSIPLVSSGTFGELRGNHFHSGLDIKTEGRIGLPVLAAADGTVARIKVSPYGYGKALYLKHPNGYTSVYAHLNSFHPRIEAWLKSEMKRLQKNEVDLFLPAGKFNFNQGDEIAFSGNTGGSGGPHLHFEIRDTRSENIINPLLFGLKVADSRPPEMGPLQVYFFSRDGNPIGQQEYRCLNLKPGEYALAGEGVVEGEGALSFGLYCFDRQDAASNKNGVYDLRLYVADVLQHEFKMETFSFGETRYVNAHIDYGLKACCNISSHRLYTEPGNALSVYPQKVGAGHLQFENDTLVPIRMEAFDVAGNVSILNFELRYKKELASDAPEEEAEDPSIPQNMVWFYEQKADLIQGLNYELGYQAGSFYRDYLLEVSSVDFPDAYSNLFSFGSREVPVHRYFDLELRATHLPKGIDPNKLFIGSFKDGKFDDYEGGTYENGWVKARTRQLGDFAILADTMAPVVKPLSNLSKGLPEYWQIQVTDDISGISSYNLWVNGLWVPVYFDYKKNRLLAETAQWPQGASKYVLKLVVEDDKKNRTEQKWDLFIP